MPQMTLAEKNVSGLGTNLDGLESLKETPHRVSFQAFFLL